MNHFFIQKESEIDEHSSAKRLMGYAFLVVFANDDTIEEREHEMLKKIALEDGVIDSDEKRILKRIFSRVTKEQVADAVWSAIMKFKEEYDI